MVLCIKSTILLFNLVFRTTSEVSAELYFVEIDTFFDKKFRSGLSTQSFLAFYDFEYSKFLNSFLTFFSKIEQQ